MTKTRTDPGTVLRLSFCLCCIKRVADHWANHGVTLISESVNYFYGRDGELTARYYGNDGIHLSNSGIKRLLHAINVHIQLVDDFDQCVYKPRGKRNAVDSAPGRFQRTSGYVQGGRRSSVGDRNVRGPECPQKK